MSSMRLGCAALLLGTACVGSLAGEPRCPERTDCVEYTDERTHPLTVVVRSEGVNVVGAAIVAGGVVVMTGEDGRASLGEQLEGALELVVSADGFVTAELTIQLTAPITIDVELARETIAPPPPPPPNLHDDAALVLFDAPDALPCASAADASVEMRNSGTTTWGAGYALVSEVDGTRIELPVGAQIAPGASWRAVVALPALGESGSYTSAWRMRGAASFGATANRTISVGCEPPLPEVPDRSDVVRAVAETYGHLLTTNTYESCGEFVQRVLAALGDAEWGHVAKTAGEAQFTPAGFAPHDVDGHWITGVSQDAIYHRASNTQVDIIGNSSANSDPDPSIWGPASTTWGVIPREHYRVNNPWVPAVPLP
jgi:hypothetical protein